MLSISSSWELLRTPPAPLLRPQLAETFTSLTTAEEREDKEDTRASLHTIHTEEACWEEEVRSQQTRQRGRQTGGKEGEGRQREKARKEIVSGGGGEAVVVQERSRRCPGRAGFLRSSLRVSRALSLSLSPCPYTQGRMPVWVLYVYGCVTSVCESESGEADDLLCTWQK